LNSAHPVAGYDFNILNVGVQMTCYRRWNLLKIPLLGANPRS